VPDHEIPSLSPLDPPFVGPKPIESVPDRIIEELQARGALGIYRKYNGYCMYATVTGDRRQPVRFFTRGVEEVTSRFPSLTEEIRRLRIPRNTLLIGEMLVEEDGSDAPALFTSIVKSNPERARQLQKEHAVRLSLFNIAIRKGKSVIHLPYRDRIGMINEIVHKYPGRENICAAQRIETGFAEARGISKRLKWEGLVLYDMRAGAAFSLLGNRAKTPRPYGCWKWKEYHEGDFVATGFVPSTAPSHPGAVKDFLLHQYNPKTSELEYWGK
jgi:ATP-dependent DNA ligase